jgi:hypothetical protein
LFCNCPGVDSAYCFLKTNLFAPWSVSSPTSHRTSHSSSVSSRPAIEHQNAFIIFVTKLNLLHGRCPHRPVQSIEMFNANMSKNLYRIYNHELIRKWIKHKYKIGSKKRLYNKYRLLQSENPLLFCHWKIGIKS